MPAPDQEHRIREGETIAQVAAAHGIDDWEDLWEKNRERLAAEDLGNPDLLPAGTRIFVPDDRDHERGRELLQKQGVPLDAYLGGASWLDPRGVVSVTLRDQHGELLPDGTKVVIRDEELEISHTEVVQNGRIERRLPRKSWTLEIGAPGTFDEDHGWFAEHASGGDIMRETLRGIGADDPTRPIFRRPPPATSASAASTGGAPSRSSPRPGKQRAIRPARTAPNIYDAPQDPTWV